MRRLGFLLAVVAAAGCADDAPADACPAELAALHLIAPGGAVELIPGGNPVIITWAPPIDFDAVLAVGGILTPINLSAGEHSFDGLALEPSIHRVALRYDCDGLTHSVGGPTQLIYRQGATMSPDILSWSLETPAEDRAFEIRTVSLSTLELELLAGDTVLVRASIPGELVAMTRSYAFTGVDADGAPLPGGMYALTLRIHARDGITYDRPGPSFFWAP